MKPINLRVCAKCTMELDGSVAFKAHIGNTEKSKCAFCKKEGIWTIFTVSDYKEETNDR